MEARLLWSLFFFFYPPITMTRIPLSLSLLFCSLVSFAQHAAWQKMTPLVRQAAIEAQSDAQQAKTLGGNPTERTLMAFVKTTDNQGQALEDYGARVHYRYNNIAIAEIPLHRLAALSADSRIVRIEANRMAKALTDTTAVLLGADRVWEGLSLPQGYTGKGVVVGIQDIGFALTHPTFWSRDMQRYRIKALWDQISPDTLSSTLPAGRDYRDSLSLLTLGKPYDGLIQTHGTHTASTAAGSGMEGTGLLSPYSGIAYDADIALVCNATSDDIALIPEEDYYKYTYALDALGFKYLFDYADSVGKPCVINFSEGSQQDFRGDDQLYYEMLADLVGPGHILVASAGNDGATLNYGHKESGTTEATIHLRGSSGALMFTTKSDDNFTLRFGELDADDKTYSLSDILQCADSLLIDSFAGSSHKYMLAAQAYRSCYNSQETVVDWTITHQTSGSAINTQLTIGGNDTEVELYPVLGTMYNSQDNLSVDNSHSTHSPGSAPAVICVGATGYRTSFVNYLGETKVYNNGEHGERTPFSAVGPTWDDRTKPDVMAPGQNIIAAYSSYYLENNPTASDISSDVRHFAYNGRTYAWNANAGTSMSTPIVTGIIALWLEAYPKLSPDDVKNIFADTCTHYDASLSYPNNLYGYGQIDAYAGMQKVLELAASGIETVKTGATNPNRIYSLDGIYMGDDISSLPHGIYIIGNRKVIK